jgi:hypothetical protein
MESLSYVTLCMHHLHPKRTQQAKYSLHRYKIIKYLLNLSKFFVHIESRNFFFDCMTVHRDRFLVNKTNRCTEFQFYYW